MKVKQLPNGPYDPEQTETSILEYWLENKFYKPETAKAMFMKQGRKFQAETGEVNKFSIVNPPPNAYARPHMGNVSGYAYQDLFGRRARMQGKVTLLFPGKDHAAQQAEIVYIRDVLAKQGKKKSDFTREEFYKNAYEHFTNITEIAQNDEKRIGLSSDFDRDMFTLDPRAHTTIMRTFEKMWKDEMVYKGVRIVNWSPGLNSAVADIDTERLTVDSTMYYLKYALPQVDQDVLNLRTDFSEGTYAAKILEIAEIKDSTLEKLNNQAQITHAVIETTKDEEKITLQTWIIGEVHEGDELGLRFIGMTIPLTGDAMLIGIDATKEPDDGEFALRPRQFEYIFKAANRLYGSAFVREFRNDDETPNNDYARGFILGTVRPETKFGDTAMSVHPEDERYKDLVDQEIELIGLNGPVTVRVITDPAIDREFGTGVMKVTPAHAPTDYEIYVRYNAAHPDNPIDYKNVIEKDGRLNHLAGMCEGMHAEKDRDKIVEIMAEHGLVMYQEPTTSNITICERTKTIIQPLMSSQWFIDTDKLKIPAMEAVASGKIQIHPEYMTKKLLHWLENLRDWPISRSIWWGYRIPVWYKGAVEEVTGDDGHIQVLINGVVVEDMQDAVSKGLMKLDLQEEFAPVLVPGRHAYAASTLYKEIKKKYPWARILNINDAHDPSYLDYETELAKVDLNENSVLVVHSLAAQATLDYLLKHQLKVKKVILLAPSTSESKYYKHYQEKGFWQEQAKYPEIKNLVDEVVLIHSDNDENASVSAFTELAAALGAERILDTGKKHFYWSDYSNQPEGIMQILDNEAEQFEALTQDELAKDGWLQDEDVFDTWFSSGQWPYATLESEGLMEFYPTSVMETGFDILELWVSRMIMLGLYMQDKIPFENVYLHGLIKAEDGQKMSKSKGNIVYTEDIISEFGADTLRLFYVVGNRAGASYRVDSKKIKGHRNFLNKLWNGTRFILMNLNSSAEAEENLGELLREKISEIEALDTSAAEIKSLAELKELSKDEADKILQAGTNPNADSDFTYTDLAMLKALSEFIQKNEDNMQNFRIGIAAEEIIQHFWHIFADIYIENAKPRIFMTDQKGNAINRSEDETKSRVAALSVLIYALKTYIKVLHPFIPFITEAIWKHLPEELLESETIMYSYWPESATNLTK